jgi:FSR family fosmidomycin resistance protein-like MFS transporter
VSAPAGVVGIDRRRLGLVAAGHGCVDLCQGAVPALLPFLMAARGLSLGSATALLTAATIALFGLGASPLLALPGVAMAVVTLRRLPALTAAVDTPAPQARAVVATDEVAAWGPFTRLVGAAVARTAAFFALQAFIPVWVIKHLHGTTGGGDAVLAVMLVAGAAGTLIGGRCADRFGRRSVLVTAMAPLALVLLILPHTGTVLFVVAVAATGLAVDGPFSTTIVLGQEYLPGRHGLASGITLGLAIGLGGLIAAGLGAVADATSLATTMAILPVFALLALACAVSLPEPAAVRPNTPTTRR